MNTEPVQTFYLEMNNPEALIPSDSSDDLSVTQIEIPQFQFNRFLYQLVGASWQWTDRLSWSDEEWTAVVESNDHQTWVCYQQGAIAGYFELQKNKLECEAVDGQRSTEVEILYFGLAPEFIGKGLGGKLLTLAVQKAWVWLLEEEGTSRVWVHTCTLDHSSALNNYQKRGFSLYKTVSEPE